MDEIDIRVAGPGKYLFRAVDRDGDTVDFLLRAEKDCAAMPRFLEHTIDRRGVPEKITFDQSGANTAGVEGQTSSAASQSVPLFGFLSHGRLKALPNLAPLLRRRAAVHSVGPYQQTPVGSTLRFDWTAAGSRTQSVGLFVQPTPQSGWKGILCD